MSKLSLLINCAALCVLLASCHTPAARNNPANSGTTPTAGGVDSPANTKVVMQPDSTDKAKGAATKSGAQTTNPAGSTTPTTSTTKPGKTKTKRIEHGSDNQAKLDSIKLAKKKQKD